MSLHKLSAAITFALSLAALPSSVSAEVVKGFIEPVTPLGQYMSLEMTIGETHTLFKMTGPDYSWFGFGFEPNMTMQGYAIIVEGTNAARTAHERNLIGVNQPGDPQASQDIEILDIDHDALHNLSTILLRRANDTGDSLDPEFPPSQNPLPMIWSYGSFGSEDFPEPNLSYHGSNGRGFIDIEFTPIPEPSGIALGSLAVGSLLLARRRRRWDRS
jgi:hypothetical protein